MIFGFAIYDLLSWLLAAFFLVGALGNWAAPGHVREDYVRWGYPDWFHRLTGVLELIVAILLIAALSRAWGMALGAAIMVAAIATLLRHHEFRHALLPTGVLIVIAITALSA
ncbi:DoxX family protein [Neorhizobium sp. JUb45]|uniref:DoxX family protein n=1 Tax=Neorhizobium sp. JUb45 TaxID=2485113 RepID=UPI0010D68733|nr:DoxX family protein [Neorhizobium sp. JUb45]TCQ99092.1 DoxX-like protein [Neorhizobium sp. JUb45]